MLEEILHRIPDYTVDHDVEGHPSLGVKNGLLRLPATFRPGTREDLSYPGTEA